MYPNVPREMIFQTQQEDPPLFKRVDKYICALAEATDNFTVYHQAGLMEHAAMDAYVMGYVDARIGADVAKEMSDDIDNFYFRAQGMQRDMTEPEIEDYVDFALNGQHS